MTIPPYLLALAFAVAYWRQRSRLNRCRMVCDQLSQENLKLITQKADADKRFGGMCLHGERLARENEQLRGANLAYWESAHIVEPQPSRIVDAFHAINRQPVRMFGGSFGREQS